MNSQGYIDDGSLHSILGAPKLWQPNAGFRCTADKLQMLNEPLPSFHDYFSILQKAKNDEDRRHVKLVHKHIHAVGLEAHETIGSYLVRLLVDCGNIDHARQVFDKLLNRSEYCWTSLLQGYTKKEDYAHAYELFKDMQKNLIDPTTYTLEVLLKACASLQCIDKSLELHFQIVKDGFEEDFFIGSSLVDLYVKCGLLEEAQVVFDELEDHDVVVWNFLIAGYLRRGLDIKALDCFNQMQSDGASPDAVSYLCALKACCNLGAFERAQHIHMGLVEEGFEKSLEVGNTLVDMYAKFGFFEEALKVVEEMPMQDVVTWSALIGYADHGLGEEALSCLQQMQSKGLHPNSITLSSCLKACSSIEAVKKGFELHAHIIVEEHETDPFVCSNLLDFYSKCGMFAEAWEIFDKCKTQDTVSSNTLMSGYVKHGLYEEALDCFDRLRVKGIHPDSVTFLCCVKACGSIPTLKRGQEIHSEILKQGFEGDSFVGNSLVDMYARCSSLSDAREAFAKLHTQDVVSWNTLIAGYVEEGFNEEALECFQQMQVEAISPNFITYIVILKACGRIGATEIGCGIHAEVAKKSQESNPSIAKALANFYADCGNLGEALQVFNELTDVDDAESWSSVLRRYFESGCTEEAFNSLEEMQLEGISAGLITALCHLKACIDSRSITRGRGLHIKIVKEGLERDSLVASLLLDMYATCGLLQEVQKVFDDFVPMWSGVEWHVIISAYAQLGKFEVAFTLFFRMQEQGILPLTMTILSLLKSCGNNLALESGKRLHAQKLGLSSGEPTQELIATTLIDMYGKFGSRTHAESVFKSMVRKDLIGWSALIGVYVCQGETELVFRVYDRLRAESVNPDVVLFVSILTVCSHAGLTRTGQEYFETMSKEYGITPIIEHYNCMIDLLSRVGQLGEAVALLENMPLEPDLVTWSSVLGACHNWGHKALGRQVFDRALKRDLKYDVICTLMWNTYADFYTPKEIKEMRNFNMLENELGISEL